MTRTSIPVTPVVRAGSEIDASDIQADAETDHKFANNGRTFLLLRCVSGGPVTITIAAPDEATPDLDVTVSTAASRIVGPFDRRVYNQLGGVVHVDLNGLVGRYDAVLPGPVDDATAGLPTPQDADELFTFNAASAILELAAFRV